MPVAPEAIQNPFVDDPLRTPDEELAARAKAGEREPLEVLLTRHLPWLYNLSLRMLHRRADAEDATQEILLKTIQALSGFRGEAKFSTWLYRIAVNHLLNVKKPKWAAADAVCSFSVASARLRQVPDLDLPDPRTVPVPVEILVEETKNNCMIGTLLCLDGRQRLVFILGEIFRVSDQVGAEIAEVTPENFRQIFSRARRDLYQYLRDNCSLVNAENECKCARKTRAFIQAGFVDPAKREFTETHTRKMRDVATQQFSELMEAYIEAGASVYRGHPFYEPAEQAEMLRRVLPHLSA
ncbi:MAG: RNA polymerase sigma factor [Terracidiphilus sp.]|jgi:RNA polymerase sigma factor (sigma-70 family)